MSKPQTASDAGVDVGAVLDLLATTVMDDAVSVLRAADDAGASRASTDVVTKARTFAITMSHVVVHLTEAAHLDSGDQHTELRQARSALTSARHLADDLLGLQRGRTRLASSVARLVGCLEQLQRAADTISPEVELTDDALDRLRRAGRDGPPSVAAAAADEVDAKSRRRPPWWENLAD